MVEQETEEWTVYLGDEQIDGLLTELRRANSSLDSIRGALTFFMVLTIVGILLGILALAS